MTIDQIHDFIRDLLDKQQKGWHSPEQIDTALDRGQMSVYNFYQPVYGVDQESQDALAPFKKSIQFNTDSTGSYAIDPAQNYLDLVGVGTTYMQGAVQRYRSVKLMTEDQITDRLDSQLRKPTNADPVGMITGIGSFKLFPDGVYGGTVYILRRPKAPKYDYTQVGRVITYSSSAPTQQLEWNERYHSKIIFKALEFLGVNLGESDMVQISQALENHNS